MHLIRATVVTLAVVLLCQAGPAAAGFAKNGKAAAYAKASLTDGTVLSFGGSKTTAAVGAPGSFPSEISITFTGKYPADITTDQVIVQVTCQYGSFCVANTRVDSADPTTIVVYVGAFNSKDGTAVSSNNVFVTVNIGQ